MRFVNDRPVASRLLSLKCKLNYKFPRATPTAFDNHPPSHHGSSLGVFWLRYLYHIKLMNYAPNDTFNKTRHICHKLRHLCLVGHMTAVLCAWCFVCYLRIFQFLPSEKFSCLFHLLLHSKQLFLCLRTCPFASCSSSFIQLYTFGAISRVCVLDVQK